MASSTSHIPVNLPGVKKKCGYRLWFIYKLFV
jgi:hypothetical protein